MNQNSLKYNVLTAEIFCIFLAVFFLLSACSKKMSPEEIALQREQKITEAKENAISEYVSSLSDSAKVSQIFLVNVEGKQKYHSVEKNDDETPVVPGGVLLFSYNISKDPLETYGYIKSIRGFYIDARNPPPFVAVDQEGGYVNRLRSLTSLLPSQKNVAELLSADKAGELYSSQARQMKNLGFHMNLAPVVEVETAENKEFLDTRSFGELDKVLSYGKILVESYEKNGISTVLKHFPGNSNADPHIGLPKIIWKASESEKYFRPFEEILPSSSAVLMSHAIFQEENGENNEETSMPACFSEFWIRKIIKEKYGFNGLVISDDIFMGALSKNGFPPEVAAVRAIESGVDVIMLSEKKFWNVAQNLLKKASEDSAFSEELDRAVKNVIRYKIKAGILEMMEKEAVQNPDEKEKKAGENDIPEFTVRVNQNYAEFDLQQFDEDYRVGMMACE